MEAKFAALCGTNQWLQRSFVRQRFSKCYKKYHLFLYWLSTTVTFIDARLFLSQNNTAVALIESCGDPALLQVISTGELRLFFGQQHICNITKADDLKNEFCERTLPKVKKL